MDFRPNIDRGMAWLDGSCPGWEHRIDMERLDLGCGCDCLLGQEFDHMTGEPIRIPTGKQTSYCDGYDYVALEVLVDYDERESLGFTTRPAAFPQLTAQWKQAILERLQKLDIRHDVLEQYKELLLATAG